MPRGSTATPLLNHAEGGGGFAPPGPDSVQKHAPPPLEPREQPKRYSFFGRCVVSASSLLLMVAVGVTIGGSGQGILLTAFVSTLMPHTGPYFVLTVAGLSFTCIFSLAAAFLFWRGGLRREDVTQLVCTPRLHAMMFLVGFFDACNGVLVVFSSPGSRTPPALQSLLANAALPLTLLLTRVLIGTVYRPRHYAGAALVMGGIVTSLVPLFHRMHEGTESAQVQAWYWPCLFMAGVIPGACMNVIQQKLQASYREQFGGHVSVTVFQAVESFYQSVSFATLFWVNVVPGFGQYGSLAEWGDSMADGFQCFFAGDTALQERCQYSGMIGGGFIASYLLSYVCGTVMTEHASANLGSMIGAISTGVPTVFWYAWPAANKWVGGAPYETMDLVWTCLAFPLIALGSYTYHTAEKGTGRVMVTRAPVAGRHDDLATPAPRRRRGNGAAAYGSIDSDDAEPPHEMCWP